MIDHVYKRSGFRVARKARRVVRARAHYVLDLAKRDFGWSATPFPISMLLEIWSSESGAIVGENSPNFDVFEPEEMPHAAAEFVPHENVIKVSRDIWDAACDGHHESRHVLAHEIGHVVLGHYIAAGLYDDSIVVPETDSEHQANWFADELLMDVRHINLDRDGIDALVDRFGVSKTMAARRIRELILERRTSDA